MKACSVCTHTHRRPCRGLCGAERRSEHRAQEGERSSHREHTRLLTVSQHTLLTAAHCRVCLVRRVLCVVSCLTVCVPRRARSATRGTAEGALWLSLCLQIVYRARGTPDADARTRRRSERDARRERSEGLRASSSKDVPQTALWTPGRWTGGKSDGTVRG
jgi:hypothetical protein